MAEHERLLARAHHLPNPIHQIIAAQLDIRLTNVSGPTNVPEPASMALLATGLIGAGMVRRRKQNAA